MYTLVVVDMQPLFQSSQKETTKTEVDRLLKKAIEDKAGIIFLEFHRYAETDPALKATVEGYKRAFFRTKMINDGSSQVVETIKKKSLPKRKIKVCGVNTNYCVRETVAGLLEKFGKTGIAKEIEVSKGGTNCAWDHETGLESMQALERCKLIE